MSTPMLLGTLGQAQSMKLGTLVQFEALNIFRYGAIPKAPPSGRGGRFTKYGILQHISKKCYVYNYVTWYPWTG